MRREWALARHGEHNEAKMTLAASLRCTQLKSKGSRPTRSVSPAGDPMQHEGGYNRTEEGIYGWKKHESRTDLPDCGRRLNGCLWCWGCPAEPTFCRRPQRSATRRLTTGLRRHGCPKVWISSGSSFRSVFWTMLKNRAGSSAWLLSTTPFCCRSRRQR